MSSKKMEQLRQAFQPVLREFLDCAAMRALAAGELSVSQYQSVLREIFHQTRENPQLHAMSMIYLRGRQRDFVKRYFAHAGSEVGHDQLALNDIETLGGEVSRIPYENPLPATSALVAFAYYQLQRGSPLSYLGYVFFLEFMPTHVGEDVARWLHNIGVTPNAMTFLRDHAEIDMAHNRIMEQYVDGLVVTDADYDTVAHAMRVTGRLYGRMYDEAVNDVSQPFERGWCHEELAVDGKIADELVTERSIAS
ncbi:MAG: iron-containing redox enzyme family protein [Parvularculaceae bacterium]